MHGCRGLRSEAEQPRFDIWGHERGERGRGAEQAGGALAPATGSKPRAPPWDVVAVVVAAVVSSALKGRRIVAAGGAPAAGGLAQPVVGGDELPALKGRRRPAHGRWPRSPLPGLYLPKAGYPGLRVAFGSLHPGLLTIAPTGLYRTPPSFA